ncbi:PDR/VanB family oxidoreductase [Gordonia terrae]
MHDHLTTGTAVRVRGPRNHFPLASAERFLFIGGGIGVTPLIPMLLTADRAGLDWTLIYGGRSASSMAFGDDLAATYGERVKLWPQDIRGLPDLDAVLAGPGTADGSTAVYCCGPEGLLQAAEQRCEALPPGTLHVERFAPGELAAPVQTGTFEVQIDSTGEVLEVSPDRSVLDVLRDAGIEIDASCEEGTCETRVIDGAVDHRDWVLTDEEKVASATMMVCVSRAACPRLHLDL